MGESKTDRIELVDTLRGFALFGLFLVHCMESYGLYWADPSGGTVADLVFSMFAGKSSALFALCFGISFFFIMRGLSNVEGREIRFLWRLFILFLIGSLHGLLYRGDILVVFALAGPLLLIVSQIRSNRCLVVMSLLLFLQIPLLVRARAAMHGVVWAAQKPFFMSDASLSSLMHGKLTTVLKLNAGHGQLVKWSYHLETGRFTQMVGLFMLGLVLGRTGFFANAALHARQRRILFLLSLLVMPCLDLLKHQSQISGWAMEPGRLYTQWAIESWQALCLLAMQIIILIEVYESAAGRLLAYLAPAGRMTLTLYVMQSLVMVPALYGFGLNLHQHLTTTALLVIGVVGFCLQSLFARWWLSHYFHGPLEWAWRAATQRSVAVPFRRRIGTATAL